MALKSVPKGFARTDATHLDDNVFTLIGKDWMLISAAGPRDPHDPTDYAVNTMTASWGTMGVLWNKPVCICFIRPQRYTFDIACNASRLSFSFLPEEYRKALNFCGSHSGREGDKFAASGLTKAFLEMEQGDPVPFAGESRLVVVGKKLYEDDLRACCFLDTDALKHYEHRDYHRFFVCEIEDVLIRSET